MAKNIEEFVAWLEDHPGSVVYVTQDVWDSLSEEKREKLRLCRYLPDGYIAGFLMDISRA
jgi:hypothetical protein